MPLPQRYRYGRIKNLSRRNLRMQQMQTEMDSQSDVQMVGPNDSTGIPSDSQEFGDGLLVPGLIAETTPQNLKPSESGTFYGGYPPELLDEDGRYIYGRR